MGIGALYGSICMFIDPTGKILYMDTVLPYFNVLPFSDILFQNYIFSGISLLIVNGISNLIVSYLIIKDKKIGFILGTIFGITLMLWIIIQFIILPTNFLSISYFIIGLITIIFYTQSEFVFDHMSNLINDINTKLNQIKINDLHKRNYLVTKSKVRSIHSSLAIEDNSLTLQDVEKISNKKTILGKKRNSRS